MPPFFSITFLTTVSNNSSTFEFFFADVSKYSILYYFAFYSAASNYTFLFSSKSALFPTNTMMTFVRSASFCKSFIQYSILSNESYSDMSNTSNAPSTDRQYIGVIVLNRSYPAVSQTYTSSGIFSMVIYFYLYSTPRVVARLPSNLSSLYLSRREDLPTPDSPSVRIFTFIMPSFPTLNIL